MTPASDGTCWIAPATALLTLHDSVGSAADACALRLDVHRLVLDGARVVVVDASRTRWLSAAMLGALVQARRLLDGRGGALRLAGPTESTTRILAVTGLDGTIPVWTSVREALLAREAAPGVPKTDSARHPAREAMRILLRRPFASTCPRPA